MDRPNNTVRMGGINELQPSAKPIPHGRLPRLFPCKDEHRALQAVASRILVYPTAHHWNQVMDEVEMKVKVPPGFKAP